MTALEPLGRRAVAIGVVYCWIVYIVISLAGSHVDSEMYGGSRLGAVAITGALLQLAVGVVIAMICFGNWSSFVSMDVPRMAATMLLATVSLAGLQNCVITAVTGRPLTWNRFGAFFHSSLLDVSLLFGIGYGIQVFEANRRRELASVQLETELARAQVQLLRTQLQPHFLFNALHSISGRIATAPGDAQTMIARLGELLRISTETAGQGQVPLREELRFIRTYLDLQQFRFGHRVLVTIDVPDETLDSAVPTFVLQPAVENSIRHAVERVDDVVEIDISAALDAGALRLTVANTGPPLADDARSGVGLRNTAQRLTHLYGERASFSIRNREEGGVTTEICIPFMVAVPARESAPPDGKLEPRDGSFDT